MKPSPIVQLHELGQSVWLDNISDGLIQSGELARWITEGSVYGVTSNDHFQKRSSATRAPTAAEIGFSRPGEHPKDLRRAGRARHQRTADLLGTSTAAGAAATDS